MGEASHSDRDSAREAQWAALMRAARAGDRAAYADLLTEISATLRPLLRARLTRLGFDAGEAEDAVQETIIAIHAKAETWDPARPIVPWVRAIARHKALDLARRLGRARAREAAGSVEDWADILAAPAPRTDDPGALILVEALPARERSVVAALGLDGQTVRATARHLGISETAVRVAFHRGLARLRARAAGV